MFAVCSSAHEAIFVCIAQGAQQPSRHAGLHRRLRRHLTQPRKPAPPRHALPHRSFIQQPVNTAQTFRDLNAELASVFGADGGQLLTPDGLRKELGAAEGADLTKLLLQAPPGSAPWCVVVQCTAVACQVCHACCCTCCWAAPR